MKLSESSIKVMRTIGNICLFGIIAPITLVGIYRETQGLPPYTDLNWTALACLGFMGVSGWLILLNPLLPPRD